MWDIYILQITIYCATSEQYAVKITELILVCPYFLGHSLELWEK